MNQRLIALVAILTISPCFPVEAQPAASAGDIPVAMSTSDQMRMGVASRVLDAREIPDSVAAIVQAVDPAPLAALDSELAAAVVATAASASELDRVEGLAAQDQSASQQALEAARARAAADRATLTLLRQRMNIEWGPGLAALSPAARADLIGAVADGRAALLTAVAPERPEGVDGRVAIDAGGDAPIAAESLGLAGKADPRMQSVGLYCVVRGDAARRLRPGRVLAGRIDTDVLVTGVVLPRAALVRLDGTVWAYVRTGDESFARREVVEPRIIDDGWFVARGFGPGVAVVDRGAGSLVAIERGDEAAEAD